MSSIPLEDNPVVLVAEDELLVRMLTVDILEEAGCAVIESANAAAALATLDKRSDVQVLVTDVEMPPGAPACSLRETSPEAGRAAVLAGTRAMQIQ